MTLQLCKGFLFQPTNFVDATNVFVQSLINLTSQPLRERILRFLWDVRNGMSIAEAKDVSTPDLFKVGLSILCGYFTYTSHIQYRIVQNRK